MTKARDIASAAPAPSTVSATEIGYLDGVTSAIQTQLNAKQAVVSGVDDTEIGYLNGVTSAVQTQLDAKTAKSTLTTTGDIYYASDANTPARLGIGSTGNVLTVASGIPSWAAPAGGGSGLTLIQRSSFSNVAGTSTTFDGVFTATYSTYIIQLENLGAATAANDMQFSLRVSGADYTHHYGTLMYNSYNTNTWSNTSVGDGTIVPISNNQATAYPLGMQLVVTNVGTNKPTTFSGTGFAINTNDLVFAGGGSASQITATGFRLSSSSSNITGTASVYGLATS